MTEELEQFTDVDVVGLQKIDDVVNHWKQLLTNTKPVGVTPSIEENTRRTSLTKKGEGITYVVRINHN